MKKMLLTIALSFAFIQTSFAFWVNPRIIINPPRTYAEARVFNTWRAPIVCSGNVAFQTRSGRFQYAYFNRQIIYPGQFAYVYAYTNIYEQFVFGRGQVNCFFY